MSLAKGTKSFCYSRGVIAFLLAAAVAAPFPPSPTRLIYRVRDFAGKSAGSAVVESSGGRLRIEAFGETLFFDGRSWYSADGTAPQPSPIAALIAPLKPPAGARFDSMGRLETAPALDTGARSARVDYRYDTLGLAAVNLVFSDGSGFQIRRASAEPATFSASEFEAPQRVEPGAAGPAEVSSAVAPDLAAVSRLLGISTSEDERRQFEREGGIGRFRVGPRNPR
jgi:hypothetical protein